VNRAAPPVPPSGTVKIGELKRADVATPLQVPVLPNGEPPMPATVEMKPLLETNRIRFPELSVTQKPPVTIRDKG
jgi:hypothetical protein